MEDGISHQVVALNVWNLPVAKQPKLIGMEQLRRAFVKKFPQKLLHNIKQEMERKADDLVNDLKLRAPVYSGTKTKRSWQGREYPIIKGALRDSIAWTWGKAPSGSFQLGESDKLGPNVARITIYAGGNEVDVFYARWVEFGTSSWLGSPFFYPTYRDHKRRIKSGMSRQLRKTIREFNR